MPKAEGWTYLYNSRKWHYFRDHTSLCRKLLLLGQPDFDPAENLASKDNCAECRRKREKELANAKNKTPAKVRA